MPDCSCGKDAADHASSEQLGMHHYAHFHKEYLPSCPSCVGAREMMEEAISHGDARGDQQPGQPS